MKKIWSIAKKALMVVFCVIIVVLLLHTYTTNVRQDQAVTEMWSRLDDRSAILFKDKEHLASLERRLDSLERKLNSAGILLTK